MTPRHLFIQRYGFYRFLFISLKFETRSLEFDISWFSGSRSFFIFPQIKLSELTLLRYLSNATLRRFSNHERCRSHWLNIPWRVYFVFVPDLLKSLLNLHNFVVLVLRLLLCAFKHGNHIETYLNLLVLGQSVFQLLRWHFGHMVYLVGSCLLQLLEPI